MSIDYARRVESYYPSKVREVFALANRPDMISFAGGAPALDDLDFDFLADASARILREQGRQALQYSIGQGVPVLREAITQVMTLEGMTADPSRQVVTVGSQFALNLVAQNFVDPGDVVLAESPSYAGGMAVFRAYEGEVRQIATDADGLVPAAVDEALRQVAAEGRRCRLVYTIPTYQNPGGTLMPERRRVELMEVCERHDVYVLEDNPYGLLGFDGRTHRAMKADHPERVFYLGSFSKIFAPGLRLGWVDPPAEHVGLLVGTNETGVLNPPTFTQLLVTAYLRDGEWQDTLAHMRQVYAGKARVMVDALRSHMPEGVTWNDVAGGFYVWLDLPERLDAYAMVARAIGRGLVYVPGVAFYVDGRGTHELRTSFCLPTTEQIVTGVEVLADVVRAELGD